MGTSVLHIKTEVECHVYLFDEEKGIAKPGTWFNLEVRKGEQDLLFVSLEDETLCYRIIYDIEENDCDYRMTIIRSQFKHYSKELLEDISLAEQEDAEAQFRLGKRYYNGDGVKQDYEEAVKWFRYAAEYGNALAQYYLGECYYYEKGVELKIFENDRDEDYALAVMWYHKAAEQGLDVAQYSLGWCYENGQGLEQSYTEAEKCYRKAAEQGYADAQYKLGEFYYNGFGVKQDYVESVKWFYKAAEQGIAAAQYKLGKCYDSGYGVDIDYVEVVKWFRKAAEQGYVDDQYLCTLGWCFEYGKGVEQDVIMAGIWYLKAFENSEYMAENRLDDIGLRFYRGDGVKQDYVMAVKFFSKAVEKGCVSAQCHLGVCFAQGHGVKQNPVKAVKWFCKAAEQGNVDAQYYLGEYYENGEGVERNCVEAGKWYYNAAEQYYKMAEFNCKCARNAENDNGLIAFCQSAENQYNKALHLFCKAAKLGNENTMNYIKQIINILKRENMKNESKPPYFFFFETETTGIPRNYSAPASDIQNWPRLVQIGWIVTDEDGNKLWQCNDIVKPEGFIIPADAARVHGITTEKAQREGKPLRQVIATFLEDFKQSKCIVGHNILFNQKVVGAELYRLGIPDTISTAKSLCTMHVGTNFCRIPGYYGYKWPNLQELYHKLFGCDFEDAHDAMADITATKKCFFEMRKRGLI